MRIQTPFIPWILASFPMLCVAFLFFHLTQAVRTFGHAPQYLVDPDPFHGAWDPPLGDAGFFFYLFSILLLPLLIFLGFRPFRYFGTRPYCFYSFLVASLTAYFIFILRDHTGFISWYLD